MENLFNSKNIQRISNLSKFCSIIMDGCKTDATQAEPKIKTYKAMQNKMTIGDYFGLS